MTNSEAVILLMSSEYYKQGYKQGVSDVLNKIRAEIKTMSGDIETIADVLAIIDKYKIESEVDI